MTDYQPIEYSLPPDCPLVLTPDQERRLEELATWLAERAHPLGLTNYPSAAAVLKHHLSPNFSLFCLVPPPLSGPVLDLGAGCGALGLTLALLDPELSVLLADRRRRSARFIALTAARLALPNAHAMQVDAEALAKNSPAAFNLVCFRALAPAPLALALAAPLLRPNGSVAVWHQSSDQGFLQPPPPWECLQTADTSLPGLSVSQMKLAVRG